MIIDTLLMNSSMLIQIQINSSWRQYCLVICGQNDYALSLMSREKSYSLTYSGSTTRLNCNNLDCSLVYNVSHRIILSAMLTVPNRRVGAWTGTELQFDWFRFDFVACFLGVWVMLSGVILWDSYFNGNSLGLTLSDCVLLGGTLIYWFFWM